MDDQVHDAADDWEGEPSYGGRPGLATAICAFLLVASCVGARQADRVSDVGGGAAVAGHLVGGAITGLILWGIAYAITIKRASPGWNIGSAIVLAVLGLITAFARVGAAGVSQDADLTAARQLMADFVATDGRQPPRPLAADAGPLTRMGAAFINARLDDVHAFDREAKDAGLVTVLSFQGLTRTSPVLDHCDQVEALEASAIRHADQFPALLAKVRREGDQAIANGTATRGSVDAFIDGAAKSREVYDRQWRLVASMGRDAGALCQILAHRRWLKGPTGDALFTAAGDLDRAQPLLARLKTTRGALEGMKATSRTSAEGQLETLGQR